MGARSSSSRRRSAPPAPPALGLPVRQLKIAALVTLLFGLLTAVILSWHQLFPVAPDKLVEVVWTHQCSCAQGWMSTLREQGFVVRDFEMDNLSTARKQWHVPDAAHGCHPATFMGYALEGHVPAEALRRLARERPKAVALEKRDTVQPDAGGKPQIVSSRLVLIDSAGAVTDWLEQAAANTAP